MPTSDGHAVNPTKMLSKKTVERRECGGGEKGFNEAQREGCAWMERHGQDRSSQLFIARATQVALRMGWDHDYLHDISKRGF